MNFKSFYISKMESQKNDSDDSKNKSLIDEVSKYEDAKYAYSSIIYFKTKKLEILKKRSSVKKEILNEDETEEKKKTIQYVVNYATPEFILCGIDKEEAEDLFYPNGDPKKIVSKVRYKVKWFNSNQMKFSEKYLPKECFIDKQPFKTLVPHNEKEEKKASNKN